MASIGRSSVNRSCFNSARRNTGYRTVVPANARPQSQATSVDYVQTDGFLHLDSLQKNSEDPGFTVNSVNIVQSEGF